MKNLLATLGLVMMTFMVSSPLLPVFADNHTSNGGAAVNQVGPGTAPSGSTPGNTPNGNATEGSSESNSSATLSSTCTTILNESKTSDAGNANQCSEENVKDDEIVVILGESIGTAQKYSCGQIVNCLREKYKTSKVAEGQVTCELRASYPQCIVSGKDGLGLLSNYASQVYTWIAGVVGSICILVIIISGIQISIGGLSQEEVSSAKDRVLRALTGLVVLFLSAFILYTINPFFFV